MTTNLTTFVANAQALRVMEHDRKGHGHDIGTAQDVFGGRLSLIQIGDAQGDDRERGAYEWYPLTINGELIGELRDDAAGMTVHISRRNHPARSKWTWARNFAAHYGNRIVTVPDQVADDQIGFWERGQTFPARLPRGATVRVRIDGVATGLRTSGTGDLTVKSA